MGNDSTSGIDRRSAGAAGRPLIVSSDVGLLDELLPLAAAGFGDVDVAGDAVAARPHWRSASLVVVGHDAVRSCVRARLPRRRDVVVVAPADIDDPDPDAVEEDDRDESWHGADVLGADHVVVLPAAASWLTERFSTAGTRRSGEAPVVGVIGGRGGSGASVLAAGLAMTAARDGRRAMLVDADPLGGGLDLLLGWEASEGMRWPDLAGARGSVNVSALYAELPHARPSRSGELVVVSWDRGDRTVSLSDDAMEATLDAGRRGSDVVVVDLPRHLDDAAIRAAQLSDLMLLVVPADVRGCAAACRVAARIGPHCRALRVVVRGPAPGRLRPKDIGQALGLPVAGTLRPDDALAEGLEHGEPPAAAGKGQLAELCTALLGTLPAVDAAREVA